MVSHEATTSQYYIDYIPSTGRSRYAVPEIATNETKRVESVELNSMHRGLKEQACGLKLQH